MNLCIIQLKYAKYDVPNIFLQKFWRILVTGKNTHFSSILCWFLAEQTVIQESNQLNLVIKMCGIKNGITYVKIINFEVNLLGKTVKKHEKNHIIVFVSFDCDPNWAQAFERQIRIPRRKTL